MDRHPDMNVLAFDTCFGAVSAAVRYRSERGEWLLREAYETVTAGHAERLLPLIADVMGGAGLRYDQLHRIAVTIGPGGFTGLRAGVAVARAMALATGLPVVGLSSLAVMAERANLLLGSRRDARPLLIAVDARRNAVYLQVFGENAGDPLGDAALVDLGAKPLPLPPGPLLAAGSGARLLAAAAPDVAIECVLPDLQPHARQLSLLARILTPMQRIAPLYLRAADAKPPSTLPIARRP
jgi:tRNA threonylcarbamoyladenosine biosynthesis protein TsaB